MTATHVGLRRERPTALRSDSLEDRLDEAAIPVRVEERASAAAIDGRAPVPALECSECECWPCRCRAGAGISGGEWPIRVERCACGGEAIFAGGHSSTVCAAVAAHNASTAHQHWRARREEALMPWGRLDDSLYDHPKLGATRPTPDPAQERHQREHELARALEAARTLQERLELLADRPNEVRWVHQLRDRLAGALEGVRVDVP